MTAAAATCRACSAKLTDRDKCERCGALQHDDIVCPHCGATADASPDRELRFACDVCGGPRVPIRSGAPAHGKAVLAALKEAEIARRARAAWRAGALAGGLVFPFLVLVTLLVGLVFHAYVAAGALALLVVLPVIAGGVAALRRAAERGRRIAPALDAAWIAAGTDVARSTEGPLTAAQLGEALRLDEAQAEELLALLQASDVVRGDMTPSGDLAFRARIGVAPEPIAPAPAHTVLANEEDDEEHARADDEAKHAALPPRGRDA